MVADDMMVEDMGEGDDTPSDYQTDGVLEDSFGTYTHDLKKPESKGKNRKE